MNEIFSNELSQLTIHTSARGVAIAPESAPTATMIVSSDLNFTGTPVTLTVTQAVDEFDAPITGQYVIAIPYGDVQGKRYAKISYTYTLTGFGAITKQEVHEVKTRLITFEEYMYMMGEVLDSTRFNEFNVAEMEARAVIQAYCNHNFDAWTGSIEIVDNPNFIQLPKHLQTFTGISEYDTFGQAVSTSGYEIEENGLALRKKEKNDKRAFQKKFVVAGDWGYAIIPDGVRKSAFELTRDFSSSAINDRRNYILNAGGGGVSGMEQQTDLISYRAYMDSTGNSIVDGLLKPYRIFNVGVI